MMIAFSRSPPLDSMPAANRGMNAGQPAGYREPFGCSERLLLLALAVRVGQEAELVRQPPVPWVGPVASLKQIVRGLRLPGVRQGEGAEQIRLDETRAQRGDQVQHRRQ